MNDYFECEQKISDGDPKALRVMLGLFANTMFNARLSEKFPEDLNSRLAVLSTECRELQAYIDGMAAGPVPVMNGDRYV